MNDDEENPNQPPMLGPGPLTLEMAEKWMRWLEDVATIERDLGAATRFVLGNLIFDLSASGVLDGQRFLLRLRERIPSIEKKNHRVAAQSLIEALLLEWRQSDRSEPEKPLH